MFLSPHNLLIMSKVFCERYHHPGLEGFLLHSGLDIDLEWDCPSLSGSSKKHHSPFNCALQSPRNEGTSSCFLLKDKNGSCLDGSSHRGTLSLASDIVNIQDLSSFSSRVPLYKDKSCPLLLDKSSWVGTWGKCSMMIVKMLPSILDKLFMISLCLSVAAHYC